MGKMMRMTTLSRETKGKFLVGYLVKLLERRQTKENIP